MPGQVPSDEKILQWGAWTGHDLWAEQTMAGRAPAPREAKAVSALTLATRTPLRQAQGRQDADASLIGAGYDPPMAFRHARGSGNRGGRMMLFLRAEVL